tara:strand:+ start:611 stop:1708 length:1098 start_codon:yes stop_codon:yes gene_type:complete
MKNSKKREHTVNFGAGPAVIPDEVLKTVQEELLNWADTGMSVMEISHRSKEFNILIEQIKNDLKNLVKIPKDFEVLFLQGGATSQFSMIPMNFLNNTKESEYVLTGYWSQKAIKEAQKFSKVNISASGKDFNFTTIPSLKKWTVNKKSSYLHYTSNETIEGIEFDFVPSFDDLPVISDMSSNFLSKPIDISSHSLIYSGTQKNIGTSGLTIVIINKNLINSLSSTIPTMFNYTTHLESDSRYNTPPVFNIYLSGLVIRWILENGGLEQMERRNKLKSEQLYNFIDQSNLFYNKVVPKFRSRMNITFHVEDKLIETKFLREAEKNNLINLKGHRSIGGFRASLYNAISFEDVEKLIQFMKKFEVSI